MYRKHGHCLVEHNPDTLTGIEERGTKIFNSSEFILSVLEPSAAA